MMIMRRYRSFLNWIRQWIALAPLAMAACSAPFVHQQKLAALHSAAAKTCRTTHLTCAKLAPCSTAVRTSLKDWQEVSVAASKGDDAGEAAALVVAASSEVAARSVCKVQGVQ